MSRPTPHTRDAYPTRLSFTTRWRDNDIYAHVNNVVYYEYIDSAVNLWLMREGLLDPEGGEIVGLVVETGCSYFASIAFPDRIEVGVRVAKLGRSSVRYEVALFRNDETTASAQGFFVHVYVGRVDRRPAALPAAWRDALSRIAAPDADIA